MRVAILDACFPLNNQTTGVLAVQYLKWNLAKYGVEITNPKDADVIMVTCTSPINTPFVKRIRKMYPSNKIIVGGAGSTSPYSFSMYSDAVCVGDGQKFIHTMCTDGIDAAISLPNSFVYGETRKVEVDQGFPWGMPPIQAEDGIYRVWCGRGCKNRCVFCQTAWAHTYSENPNPDRLIHQIEYLLNHNHKVNYLSNDPAQHSFYNRLPPVGHGSYSFRFLKKNGLPPAREIRMGVEGVSERLRAAVGKPIPHDDLVGCTSWLNTNHKGVRS